MDVRNKKNIAFFEAKLNKWIKMFEASERENANRHNTLVTAVNEVDDAYNKETRRLANLITGDKSPVTGNNRRKLGGGKGKRMSKVNLADHSPTGGRETSTEDHKSVVSLKKQGSAVGTLKVEPDTSSRPESR